MKFQVMIPVPLQHCIQNPARVSLLGPPPGPLYLVLPIDGEGLCDLWKKNVLIIWIELCKWKLSQSQLMMMGIPLLAFQVLEKLSISACPLGTL